MTERIKALYSPSKRQVACVLLAAAFGGGREVCLIFDSTDWFVAPQPDMRWISATPEQWRELAAMAPEDRPGPEEFEAAQATKDTAG